MTMAEVDKARAFIEAVKSHSGECSQTNRAWNSEGEAIDWLGENIKASDNSGTSWEQTFSTGARPYLAVLKSTSTDSKGTQNTVTRTFDLSDIDPTGVSLVVSGKSLKVVLPVRAKNNYIMEKKGDEGITYARDLDIYTDDIEAARNIVNAFNYLASNTKVTRKEWKNDGEALGFVKANLGKTEASGKTYDQTMDFEAAPSGKVTFKTVTTDSKGGSSTEESVLYLNDLQVPVELNVDSRSAWLGLNTKDKAKYIRQTKDGADEPWSPDLKLYVNDIDLARDLASALDYAASNSSAGDAGLSSQSAVIAWLQGNVGELPVDGKNTKQSLKIEPGSENRITLDVVTAGTNGSSDVKEQFILYPEDLSTEDNVIKVSGKKLYVPLSTGKLNYIKVYRDGAIQNYTRSADVYFNDVHAAKLFTQAIAFLAQNTKAEKREPAVKDAWGIVTSLIGKVDETGEVYEQGIEKADPANACKVKFSLGDTDSKGATTKYAWEFMLTDIDPSASNISVSSKEIHVNLVTKGRQKLIKPYKNDEAQNFDDGVVIRTNDIVEAKKLLGAFTTLAKECK